MRIVFLLVILFTQSGVRAACYHPFSISWASASIHENKIRLSVKITAEDLLYFQQVGYDSLFTIGKEKLKEASQNHARTILSSFPITDQDNKRLKSAVINTNFSSLDAKSTFGIMELLKYPLYYQLEFELTNAVELLTYQQTLSDVGVASVSILDISINNQLLVENIELSKGQSFTMARDAVSLGTASESTLMLSYIRLSDTEITHELTVPYKLLKSFISLKEDSANAATLIREFISENSKVEIDTAILEPEQTTLTFQNSSQETLNDYTLVNIHIAYSLKSIPKDIAISWNSFNWKVRWFKSLIDNFGEPAEHNFSRFTPTYRVTRKIEVKSKEN